MASSRLIFVFGALVLGAGACTPATTPLPAVTGTTSVSAGTPTTAPSTPTSAPAPTATPLPEPAVLAPDNASGLQQVYLLGGHANAVRSLAFSPDSSRLVTGTGGLSDHSDQRLRLWAVGSGELMNETARQSGIIWDVTYSPDGQVIASAEGDDTVRLWRGSDLSPLGQLKMTGQVNSVAISPDGQQLAAGVAESDGGFVYLWDLPGASVVRLWKAESISVASLAFSPDGSTLATGAVDRTIRLWRVADGSLVRQLSLPGQSLAVAYMPSGDGLGAGMCSLSDKSFACLRGEAWLWSLPSGHVLQKLTGPDNWVNSVAFSPDGMILAGGAGDGKIYFWRTSDGVLLSVLSTDQGSVESVAVSPDGRWVASAHIGGAAVLWGVLSGSGSGGS